MNVLMTADTVGGVWTYAVQLCRALDRHGVRVTLATMGEPLSTAQHDDVRGLHHVAVHESGYALEWMDEPWRDVAAAGEWLLDLERDARPDVVHLNGYAHGALPWRAPVLMVGHSCVLSWWRAVHGTDAPARYDRYRAVVAGGLHAAQLVAAPTHAMLDQLAAHYGPIAGRVIPNGVDGHARPSAPLPDVRGRREDLVLAAGRAWDDGKNLGVLSDAAPAVHWPVLVAGPDVHPSGARRTLPHVQPLGVLGAAALRQWYGRASIFVQPSLYEPFGLAPLEAALHGCALVLGDIASLREVWGDAAVYAPPRNAVALAAAINSLADDHARLAHYAAAAQRRARRYTARRLGRACFAAYSTLSRTRPRSALTEEEVAACAS